MFKCRHGSKNLATGLGWGPKMPVRLVQRMPLPAFVRWWDCFSCGLGATPRFCAAVQRQPGAYVPLSSRSAEPSGRRGRCFGAVPFSENPSTREDSEDRDLDPRGRPHPQLIATNHPEGTWARDWGRPATGISTMNVAPNMGSGSRSKRAVVTTRVRRSLPTKAQLVAC